MPSVRIRVRGQVQGVGFRPFVWQLAQRFGLRGHVLNDSEGVLIHAVGTTVPAFLTALTAEAPPLSRIDAIEVQDSDFTPGDGFEIAASQGQGAETRITPDAATCPDCLREIQNPDDRRYGYPFANCTHCGPRFTIIEQLPYDRANTTMRDFPMCSACRAEYENPADRRFHAQPVACEDCGPRVWIEPEAPDWLEDAAARLLRGEILAIKGLGGFHLAVDATNEQAIETLRVRKHRPAKPFALMAPMDVIRRYGAPNPDEVALLEDAAAPVVLLPKIGADLPEVLAPSQSTLGWMLPYTPLHQLLLKRMDRPLVMTSGNLSGEPQVIHNQAARDKLKPFADAFVMHNRDIARRLDDSVERITPHGPMVLRRARGRVPGTLPLPKGFEGAPQVVAYGGQMKGAICLIKNGQALLGHHLGELDNGLTRDAFLQADRDYAALFDHRPDLAASDLHPDYFASRHAYDTGLPVVDVQHHHAHLASCLAENGWPIDGGTVAGIILDGTGLGTDGTLWGGEVLLGDYHGFERRHWLTPAPLVGGDMAAREPWRNALVRLDQAGLSDWADALFPKAPRDAARMAAAKGVNSPMSSSVGRLFDAVAAILGICPSGQSFEGEAAMKLEAMKSPHEHYAGFGFGGEGGEIDPAPAFIFMKRELEAGKTAGWVSELFHVGLARAFALQARALVASGEARAVALTGGCFQNARLLSAVLKQLGDVPVMFHTKTPANDGGLALGQAVVAAASRLKT